jgi:hypothetical protein
MANKGPPSWTGWVHDENYRKLPWMPAFAGVARRFPAVNGVAGRESCSWAADITGYRKNTGSFETSA